MNRAFVVFPAFLMLLACISCSSALERKLKELDSTISHREEYAESFMHRTDSLRAEYTNASTDSARCSVILALYNAYRYYQMDSAMLYLDKMGAYPEYFSPSQHSILQTEILISLRDYDHAMNLLQGVDTLSLSPQDKAGFFHSCLLLYANMAVDELLPQAVREEMLRKRYEYRKKYISCPEIDSFEYTRRQAIQMYEDGNPAEAIPILEKLYEQCTSIHRKEDAAYSLANAYLAAGDRAMTEYWFAQSSIHSMKEPNRVYLSLYQLAMMLFEDRDLDRASRYTGIAMADALDCNYSPRIFNSAMSQNTIVKVVDRVNHIERMTLTFIILAFAIMLSVIVFLFVRTFRQSCTLHETSSQLEVINGKLEQANKIKEGYVSRYITMSADYLGKIEELRHKLRISIKEGDTDTINKLLRDPRFYEQEYNNFYKIFDETFIGIFPDFVEKVNSLLKPGDRFELKNGNEFPTGLRILAAIKLGITDSGKIAKFLSCAPSSVYTHRCKIKKSALCDPEKFEDKIFEI